MHDNTDWGEECRKTKQTVNAEMSSSFLRMCLKITTWISFPRPGKKVALTSKNVHINNVNHLKKNQPVRMNE